MALKRHSLRGTHLAALALILTLFALWGCAGGSEPTVDAERAQSTTGVQEGTTGGEPVGVGQDETREALPFVLNTDQPVPPDFRAAYQRRTLISVQFYATSRDPFYPQGLGVDSQVNSAMDDLRGEYPTIEFFSYDISDPGDVGAGDLEPGQYGTLAAQLNVDYTPFVATMAPSGDGYAILNRYQGFTPKPVLSQALFDLSSIDVSDNQSDVGVNLDRVALTGSGGGVEYLTVSNVSPDPVDLQGFSLRVMDPETGEATTDSPGVTIDESVEVPANGSTSIGRVPDVEDGDGNPVAGTFSGGEKMDLQRGDQVTLLDSGGAVSDTQSVR